MTDADCGDPNCPYRKEIHAARKLLGEAYGRFGRLCERVDQPPKEKNDWIPPPDGWGISQAEWTLALKGTHGSTEERTRQALRALRALRALAD